MAHHQKKIAITSEEKKSKKFFPLIACITFTFIVRLLFIIEVQSLPFATVSPQMPDPWVYHRWAFAIIRGNIWGSEPFFLRPLYPYLIALLYTLFGQKLIVIQVFQTIAATLSCFLLYEITTRIFNRTAGFIAGIIFALCGILVFYTGTLLYVEITILLSLLTVYALLLANHRRWVAIPAGIAFGFLIICRPEFLLLLPLLTLWLIRRKNHLLVVLLFNIITILIVALVPLRNYIVTRDPVLFTAHAGINFYFGNNPAADGTWQPAPELNTGIGFSHERLKRTASYINQQQLPWSRASAYWVHRGLNFISSHPGKWLKLLGRKFLLFWSNYEIPNNYYPETVRPFSRVLKIAFINFGIVACIGIIGMLWAWRQTAALPLYLFIVGYMVSALVFYVLSRLRAPVLPFLMAFASYAITEVIHRFRQRKIGHLIPALVFILLGYIASNIIPVNRSRYSSQAWTQIGNIYLERHRFKLAVPPFQMALQFDPENILARYGLIEAYAAQHQTQAAETEFAKLRMLTNTTNVAGPVIHLAAARIAIAHRNFPAAAQHYHAALAIDPDNPETNYLLGLVYITLHCLDSARIYLERALAIDPNNDAAHAALNLIQRR